MNTRKIPAFVMLLAGAVVTIVTFVNHYSLEDMLVILILTLIGFLIVGIVIKLVFDSFHIEEPDEDKVDDDGEVVEKTAASGEEGAEGSEGSGAASEDQPGEGTGA